MNATWRAAGVLVAGAALALLALGSRAPLRVAATDHALLRLSLGARPERIETCRAVADDELAKVLPQMRQRLVCDGTTARYRLAVRRGSTVLFDRVVRGGGLRHDRQLYVFAEMPVAPGPARYHVTLARVDTVAPPADTAATAAGAPDLLRDRAQRERDERRRRLGEAVPPFLELVDTIDVKAGQVILLTYRPEERRLLLLFHF